MIPRGLVIAVCAGAAAGAVFGIIFADHKTGEQLVYVDGASLSVVTERTDFKRGEEIRIRLVNSGTIPLVFADASYGVRIVQLDGIELYSPDRTGGVRTLEPRGDVTLVWDQTKHDGDAALHGTYRIVSTAAAGDREIGRSVTVNIFK